MKQYGITAKLWVKIDSETPEEAQALSKHIIDEALIEYVSVNKRVPGNKVRISKAKIIWTKENTAEGQEQ